MNNRILYLYIFLIIFFADAYFVLPWLRPITIFNYILIILFLISKPKPVSKEVKNFQKIFLFFIAYTFVIDLYQNDIRWAFSSLISFIPVPFIFMIFSRQKKNDRLIYFFAKWYLIYNGFFAILQLMGVYVTAGELLAKLPFLDVDQGFWEDFGQGLRISGAGFSTIEFACILGIIFILFYYTKNKLIFGSKERKLYLIVMIFFMIMTQTRSVLYSIIPVIYITNILISKKRVNSLMWSSAGTLLLLGLIVIMIPIIEQSFPRLFLSINEDGSLVHRIQSNVYGVVGTFYQSPVIGIPFDQAIETMDLGFEKIGLFIGDIYLDQVTEHNQPAYFFKYYGFIGLIFFILIYSLMFKIALIQNKSETNKKILFAIILFHFLYTLLHSNKFTTDYYIWIFMALQLNNVKKIKNIPEHGAEKY